MNTGRGREKPHIESFGRGDWICWQSNRGVVYGRPMSRVWSEWLKMQRELNSCIDVTTLASSAKEFA